MDFIPQTIKYPDSEKAKLNELSDLFERWYQTFRNKEFPKDNTAADLGFDGFYPYYFSQKKRILFIGRESLGLMGRNYISVLYNAYKNRKCIGDTPINKSYFHKRLFYIAYAILNSFPGWNTIPFADKLADTFATAEGISFAFMNISKFSNESDNWNADWELINSSYEESISNGNNLIKDEMNILEPEIIITMNLGHRISSFGELQELEKNQRINVYELTLNNRKKILLLDTFHFSSKWKRDERDFYLPVKDAIRKYGI